MTTATGRTPNNTTVFTPGHAPSDMSAYTATVTVSASGSRTPRFGRTVTVAV